VKVTILGALVLLAATVQASETNHYEGSSTIGKFIADAAIFYPHADYPPVVSRQL